MIKHEIIIFDEEISYGLDELCDLCRISTEHVIEFVEEGVLTPVEPDPAQWHFDCLAIKRLQTAIRLQRDLKVNLAGVALVLDLLDELRELRQRSTMDSSL